MRCCGAQNDVVVKKTVYSQYGENLCDEHCGENYRLYFSYKEKTLFTIWFTKEHICGQKYSNPFNVREPVFTVMFKKNLIDGDLLAKKAAEAFKYHNKITRQDLKSLLDWCGIETKLVN